MNRFGEQPPIRPPSEIGQALKRFRGDHLEAARTGFLIMKLSKSDSHARIASAIRTAVSPIDLVALRADDKQYHDDLFWNVLTYVYGCGFGIAVFERIEQEEFNPNVAFEVGFMLALGKPVCLLKDKTLRQLQTDLMGRLYREFDPQNPSTTIPPALVAWLRDKGFGVDPNTGITSELTRRQREIVRLIATGSSYRQIAEELGIQGDTLRAHVKRIYEKWHVYDHSSVKKRAVELGVVSPEP